MGMKKILSVLATIGVCMSLVSCNILPGNPDGTGNGFSGGNEKEMFAHLLEDTEDGKQNVGDEEDGKQNADDEDDDKQNADDADDTDGNNKEGFLPGDTEKYGYTYKIAQIKYVDDENSYLIAYPELKFDDGRDASDMNEIIKRCASYEMDMMYPIYNYNTDYYQGRCESNVSFEVTYCDENIFSVVFSDHYFVGSIFAEYIDYRSVVIDLNTGESFKLGAVIDADDDFAEKMYKQLLKKDEEWNERHGFDSSMMKQAIINGITDDSRYLAYLYITPEGELGIAFSYHYGTDGVIARGCIDLQASDGEIKNIKRDSKLWEYLGK